MVRTAVSDMVQSCYRSESSTSCSGTPIPPLEMITIARLTTSSPGFVQLDHPWLFPPLLQGDVLDPVFPHAVS